MTCPDMQERITRYAAGELSPGWRKELETHLLDCPSCREELSLAVRLEDLLERWSPVSSPPGMVDRIMRAVGDRDLETLHSEVFTIFRERSGWSVRRDLLPSLCLALAGIFLSIGLGISWPAFSERLFPLIRGMIRLAPAVRFLVVEGGGTAGTNLLIAGLAILFSLLVAFVVTFPALIRWRDALRPF